MKCAWKELLSILPMWLRGEVDKYKDSLQEIRLRLGQNGSLDCCCGRFMLSRRISQEDLNYVMNTACRYSPWTAAGAANGYITAPGGHRIGLCGETVVHNEAVSGFRTLSSVNIRIARDFPGIGQALAGISGSALILGRPGSGKTTLLRDLIRQLSRKENVAVVDERGELFPQGLDRGEAVDILSGCPKQKGLDMLIRTMSPDTVAIDEITAREDCQALLQAGWCGVRLLATAHAAHKQDLLCRQIYRPLMETRLFSDLIILNADKSYRVERI